MALEKFATTAPVLTHGAVPATILDVAMPHTELVGQTSNLLRSAGYGLAAWVLRGKKETGSFSLS